jgi:DNA-binding NtrC family response regulator
MEAQAVLIVDDEAILLLSMRQELKLVYGSGLICETALCADDGILALERLGREGIPVVLVVSDLLMPGMRGDEFLKKVSATWPGIKLAMLSGHADLAEMERMRADIGLFACIRKPYRRGDLTDLIDRVLSA